MTDNHLAEKEKPSRMKEGALYESIYCAAVVFAKSFPLFFPLRGLMGVVLLMGGRYEKTRMKEKKRGNGRWLKQVVILWEIHFLPESQNAVFSSAFLISQIQAQKIQKNRVITRFFCPNIFWFS